MEDRVYALIDGSDGNVATAKNPRKWLEMFNFRAALVEAPRTSGWVSPVRITLPDGTIVGSEQADVSQILSKALRRDVTLSATPTRSATAEEYWPDIGGLETSG